MLKLRVIVASGLLAAVANLHGCQFFPHWMQPSQLWKLNRQPAWDDTSFSVPDPINPPVTVAAPAAGLAPRESS
jgi:hypothetical protein